MTTVSSFKASGTADDRRLPFDRVSALVAALAIVYGLALWLLPIPVKTFDADTASYLQFLAYRSAGYPWALRLCAWAFGTPLAVIPLQIWAYAAAGFFAIDALWRRTGSRVAIAIAGAAIFGNPFVALFHLKLMRLVFRVVPAGARRLGDRRADRRSSARSSPWSACRGLRRTPSAHPTPRWFPR